MENENRGEKYLFGPSSLEGRLAPGNRISLEEEFSLIFNRSGGGFFPILRNVHYPGRIFSPLVPTGTDGGRRGGS